MILESLIAATCTLGSPEGCENAAKAYYKHKHFDRYVENFRKRNPTLDGLFTVGLSAGIAFKEKRAVLPSAKTRYGIFITEIGVDRQQLIYRIDF